MSVLVVTGDGGTERAHVVTCDPATTTVGDLARAVGITVVGGSVAVDGCSTPAHTPVAGAVAQGARLDAMPDPLPPPGAPGPAGGTGLAAVELRVVAGLGAGAALAVPAGRYAVGAAPDGAPGLSVALVDRPLAVVDLDPDVGRTLALHGAVLQTAAARPATRRTLVPDDGGLVPLHRSPMPAPAPAIEPPPPPVVPTPPGAPAPLSWVTLVGPIPVAVGIAAVTSPRYALLGLVGPVLAVGRWIECRARHRRQVHRHAVEAATRRAEHAAAHRAAGDAEVERRWSLAPNPRALTIAAEQAAPPIWHRRAGDPDALRLTVAAGPAPWRPARGNGPPAPHGTVGPAPLEVALLERRAIGIAGDPDAVRAVARWLLLQAALLHGPADLIVAAVFDHDGTSRAWDWLKWLPHLTGAADRPRTATGDDVGDLCAELAAELRPRPGPPADPAPPGAPPLALVLAAGPESARSRALRELILQPGSRCRAVVTSREVERLPAWCDVVIEVAPDGTGRLTGRTGDGVDEIIATGVDAAFATEAARHLRRLRDPELAHATGIPTGLALAELLGHARLLADPRELAAHLGRRWAAGRGSIAAPIGATPSAPFVLDLVADGPHALVAGTTGAGKSELLRTWIAAMAASASPDDLNLLLVDFKGGGAFDACGSLPHTVAVVTDLDDHLAARALRCLRAEVRHREVLLRRAGCTDLAEYARSGADVPLPRLVLVIDEFATLAAELPAFLGSIVDVAQRGRSLGIHLVLATQRPAGVVDNKVRANTNIRIALRLQDDGDSLDVIGAFDAARLARTTPGRAYARLGSGDVTAFQVAFASGTSGPLDHPTGISARPFELRRPGPGERPAGDTRTTGATAHADLRALVDAARVAAQVQRCRTPRLPWPPPLPDRLDALALWRDHPRRRGEPILGLADEPDRQRQIPWRWRVADGPLLVLGTDQHATAQTVLTLALGLSQDRGSDDTHLYVIDGGPGALAVLGGLPQCGAYARGDDTATTARVLEVVEGILDRRRGADGANTSTSRVSGDPPLVVVLIANAGGALDAADGDAASDTGRQTAARLARLLRDGTALGVAVALTVPHERALSSRITSLAPQRLVLRLADSASYLSLGLVPRDLPALSGLRAVVAPHGTEVQIATIDDPTRAVRAIAVQGGSPDHRPEPVPVLTPRLRRADLALPWGTVTDERWSLVIAATPSCRPALLELPPGVHALVSGPPGSGRSTALTTIGQAARAASGGRVHLILVAPRWGDVYGAAGLPPPAGDVGAVRHALAAAGDNPCLVLVDDAELVPTDVAEAAAAWAAGGGHRRHVVVVGRPETLRSPSAWTAPLRAGRTGLALVPAPGDGDVFRTALPPRLALSPSVGRGYVISLGTPCAAQVVLPA